MSPLLASLCLHLGLFQYFNFLFKYYNALTARNNKYSTTIDLVLDVHSNQNKDNNQIERERERDHIQFFFLINFHDLKIVVVLFTYIFLDFIGENIYKK